MKKVTELIKRNDKNCKMNNNLLGPQSVMLAVKKLLLPIDINWFFLAKSVDSKDWLNIMRWIPGSIENDDSIGSHQVDTESSGFGGNEKESHVIIFLVIEVWTPSFADIRCRWTIHTVIVLAMQPRTKGQVSVGMLQKGLNEIQGQQTLTKD